MTSPIQTHTMTGMHALRNRRFRRWVAGGLALTWLFTVLACAVDTDAVAAAPAHVSHLASPSQSGSTNQHDGGTQDDPCCQWQASAVPSLNLVKLPTLFASPMIVSLVLLFVFAPSATVLSVGAARDENLIRRRFEFLAHSLQAQAPPR